jgi:hypothetical protein
MIEATVVADSVCANSGVRITTFELTMPKCLLAQFNKHNLIRNSAESSRARPTQQILQQLNEDPYKPPQWNYRQRGMQPAGPMSFADDQRMAELEWKLRSYTKGIVMEMEKLKAAKEDINRYLEPWMYAKVVATGTDWDNYWKLRIHGDAQGAHRLLAKAMHEAYEQSTPVPRWPCYWVDGEPGVQPVSQRMLVSNWHLPYVTEHERKTVEPTWLPQISAARVGRASYGRQGEQKSLADELSRAQSFVQDGHWTPLEGPARLWVDPDIRFGAYRAWMPLRKHYAGESGTPNLGCQKDILPWAIRSNPSNPSPETSSSPIVTVPADTSL